MKEFEELDRQLDKIIDEYNKIGDKGERLEAQILRYSDAWSKKKLDAKRQELEEIDDKMSELLSLMNQNREQQKQLFNEICKEEKETTDLLNQYTDPDGWFDEDEYAIYSDSDAEEIINFDDEENENETIEENNIESLDGSMNDNEDSETEISY